MRIDGKKLKRLAYFLHQTLHSRNLSTTFIPDRQGLRGKEVHSRPDRKAIPQESPFLFNVLNNCALVSSFSSPI
jgi:hypothetical protein